MKFSGIPEDKDKSGLITEKKIRDLFIEKLKLKYVGEIDFQRVHRLDAKKANGQKQRHHHSLCLVSR